jgi:hypothetical protein
MTKAKRVPSTPRRAASKIQQAKSIKSEDQRDLVHAQAFRDLEAPVRELYLMGEIVIDLTLGGVHEDQTEMMHFSIYHLCEMIREFRAKYRADLLDKGKAARS